MAFGRIFRSCCRVASLDSGAWGGNTILLASTGPLVSKSLCAQAEEARLSWGLRFDAAARVEGARRLRSL